MLFLNRNLTFPDMGSWTVNIDPFEIPYFNRMPMESFNSPARREYRRATHQTFVINPNLYLGILPHMRGSLKFSNERQEFLKDSFTSF